MGNRGDQRRAGSGRTDDRNLHDHRGGSGQYFRSALVPGCADGAVRIWRLGVRQQPGGGQQYRDSANLNAHDQTILPEGNGGETLFTFLIQRRGDREQPIEIPYSIAGTGVNPANSFDFGVTFPDGVVRLAAGEASGFITLGVVGDFLLEPTEAFSLTLLSPSTEVIIGPTTASGTIQDDDFLFAYSVSLVKKPDNTEANDDSAAAAGLLLDYSAETDPEEGDKRSHTNVSTAGEEGQSQSRAGQRSAQEAEDLRASLGEVRLFFVQVDVSGLESAQKYALPVNMLEGDRLLELFKKFPNGHYRVYLEQDRSLRTLYDLHIYGHQLTTPEVPSAQPPTSEEVPVAPLTSVWNRRCPFRNQRCADG